MQKTTGAWNYKEGVLIIILWMLLLVISVVMLWKYHYNKNGLLDNILIAVSIIIILFSILNILPFCFPVCLDYELEHGLFHMQ